MLLVPISSTRELSNLLVHLKQSKLELAIRPVLSTQAASSYLFSELDFSDKKLELLSSKLKDKNLFPAGTTTTIFYHTQEKELYRTLWKMALFFVTMLEELQKKWGFELLTKWMNTVYIHFQV